MSIILTEFWPFIAFVLIVALVFEGVAMCIRAWRGEKDD